MVHTKNIVLTEQNSTSVSSTGSWQKREEDEYKSNGMTLKF
jgi:hypothetical protein